MSQGGAPGSATLLRGARHSRRGRRSESVRIAAAEGQVGPRARLPRCRGVRAKGPGRPRHCCRRLATYTGTARPFQSAHLGEGRRAGHWASRGRPSHRSCAGRCAGPFETRESCRGFGAGHRTPEVAFFRCHHRCRTRARECPRPLFCADEQAVVQKLRRKWPAMRLYAAAGTDAVERVE